MWANAWDVFHRTLSRCGRGRRAAVDIFRGVYWVRRDFFGVFFFVFLERTRPTARTRTPCLVYLSTSNEAYCGIKGSVTVNKTGSRTDLTDSMV